MDNLSILSKYFYAGRAEAEKDFIKDVFVTNASFYDIITPQNRTIRLLVGDKGTGKSAILEYLNQKCVEQEIPSILLKPDDILDTDFQKFASTAGIIHALYKPILDAIAIKVGENLSGLLSPESNSLLEKAIKDGLAKPSVVNHLLRFLMPIGKAITNIDFEKMLPENTCSMHSEINAVNAVLDSDNKTFYVLFDDIDQICNASNECYFDVIWGAILAFQKIAENLPNIKSIITIRTEIWRRIVYDKSSGRDQVDHIRPMIKFIRPDTENMIDILRTRLRFCATKLNYLSLNIYLPFFEGDKCKMPRTNAQSAWQDFLITSSRFRPRDTVQLVQKLCSEAIKFGKPKIDSTDIESTAASYSKERSDDLIKENVDLCPQLEPIIRSFQNINFELDAIDVERHLHKMSSICHIDIQGHIIKSEEKEDCFKIWELLYEIGFLTPRIADSSMPRGFRYVRPYEDTTLVSIQRWNDIQKYRWDIHPCFRVFLIEEHNKSEKMQLSKPSSKFYKGNSIRNRRREK